MKRHNVRLASILAALVLAGAGMATAQTPPWGGPTTPPVSLCPKLALATPAEDTATSLRGRSSFSAAKTTDIVFHLLFDPSLADDHVVTVKIFTPHGYLYRTLDVPIATKKGEAPLGSRRLPGYPYPVKVQAPRSVTVDGTPYVSVDVSFPVAGSSIVTGSLYGQWRAEVHMDGQEKACSNPLYFQIRP